MDVNNDGGTDGGTALRVMITANDSATVRVRNREIAGNNAVVNQDGVTVLISPATARRWTTKVE